MSGIECRVSLNEEHLGVYNIEYISKENDLISIVINGKNDKIIVESINNLNYKNVEIIKSKKNYGYSKSNNIAVKKSNGKYILFVNNVEILSNNCLERFLGYFSREDIGLVTCKVVTKDDKVYHNGIGINNNSDKIEYMFNGLEKNNPGYMCRNIITRNVLAATDIIMVRKSDFEKVKGFDENIESSLLADVEFCKKLKNKLLVNDSNIIARFI